MLSFNVNSTQIVPARAEQTTPNVMMAGLTGKTLSILSDQLGSISWDFSVAQSPQELLDCLTDCDFDVVVLDVDGLDTQLQTLPSSLHVALNQIDDLPIVVTGSNIDEDHRAMLLSAGARAIVDQSVEQHGFFRHVIREVLLRRGLRDDQSAPRRN